MEFRLGLLRPNSILPVRQFLESEVLEITGKTSRVIYS